jgi:hypothetical protein
MRWVPVDIAEREAEPDWSQVPPERVAVLRERWERRPVRSKRWLVWEPQLGTLYRDSETMTVRRAPE